MDLPISQDSITMSCAKKFITACDSWFLKYIVRPIFFVLPPTFFTMLATRKGLQVKLSQILGNGIGDFINESALIIVLGAYFYVVILKAIYAAIEKYAFSSSNLNSEDLLALIKTLDVVVGDKSKRMSREARKLSSQTCVCGKTTFLQITRPDQQISLLVAGIKSMFEYMDKTNADFRVGLLKIANDKAIEWYSFEPESFPPRTPAEALNAPTSTVSNCIKRKSIIVVDDIQKELKKKSKSDRTYMKGNTQKKDHGSQLSFPIMHPTTNKIEYVITIAGNRTCCLKNEFSEIYTWILRHFAVRINLEHSLHIMKERANDQDSEAA